MDMDMGGMDMGSSVPGVPSLDFLMQYYWFVVASFIGIATLVNVGNVLIARQRLSAARHGHAKPAKPEAFLLRVNAAATAIFREASNATLSPLTIKGHTIRLPTVGRTSIVAANIATLLVLCFYHFDLSDQWSFEDIGYRTGCISIAQLPLIFLLAGKNNIIGWLTGSSYERLNWLHRWTARCLLLTVTIHMGYWFADWAPYNYIGRKITTDPITQHGLISWCLLLWIVFSSVAPIRGFSYEFFVLQHLGSMAVFIAFVYMHVNSWPLYVRIYIILPIALVCFDRFVRSIWVIYNNLSIFHHSQRKEGQMSRFWACEASFTPLPHNTTRITILNPPISWKPGQHVYLSCHTIVPLQSHPFTIASIPDDGKMEFYVKSEGGATARFFRHAEKLHLLPSQAHLGEAQRKAVAIDGPYGRLRPLRQFDSVVLFAGSTGVTFTIPLLRDIVAHWKKQHQEGGRAASSLASRILYPTGVVTRRVRFVWVVKSRGQLSWFAAQLSQVAEEVAALRQTGVDFDVDISVYVTCDPAFTGDSKDTYSDDGGMKPPSTPPTLPTPIFHTPLNEKTFFKRSYDGTRVTELDDQSSDSSSLHSSDEKEQRKSALETGTVEEACGAEGTCCCQATVEEAEGISSQPLSDAIQPVICTCCNHNTNTNSRKQPPPLQPSPIFTSTTRTNKNNNNPLRPCTPPPPATTTSAATQSQLQLHPAIILLSGRPHPESITRRVLERALGETAVVVCGPTALACDVRAAVIRLSDERAVHRGTGAQGVWCHVEGFGW